jgi:hypothetical protein
LAESGSSVALKAAATLIDGSGARIEPGQRDFSLSTTTSTSHGRTRCAPFGFAA